MVTANILTITLDVDYLPLLIVAATAWLVPMLLSIFKLKKIPSVIIEIIAGFFVGKYLLNMFPGETTHILDFLALTGFIFLMFLSGLEINVDEILTSLPRKKITMASFLVNPFFTGLVIFLSTLVFSYALTLVLANIIPINNLWYFSLILVTSSVGIIVPVLKNRGEISSRFGQMIIVAAAIADILSIILFTITAYTIRHGFEIEILLILILFLAFFIFYHIGLYFKKFSWLKKLIYQLSHAALQISTRGAILLIMIFIVIAQFIDNEAILLGAFLAGLLLSTFQHKKRSLLIIKLDSMGYGFFIPIFFIMIGAQFDPSAFAEFDNSLILFLVGLILSLFAVKVIPALIWSRVFGVRKAISGGFLLASRLSLIIAASEIGLNLGVISPGINACFLLMAVVTCFFSPVIYNILQPTQLFAGDKAIIIGGSSSGVLLARRLAMHGKSAVIVENKQERYDEMRSKGLTVFLGDGNDINLYKQFKLCANNYVIVMTGSDEQNIEICRLLRQDIGHESIISKSDSLSIELRLKKHDVEILDITRVIATTIENLILRPTTYHALVETFQNFTVEEFIITNKNIDGQQVKQIAFHNEGSIMMIKRKNEAYVPCGDTYLRIGDIVAVFGTNSAIDDYQLKLTNIKPQLV